jgi:TrmH family RNA methyltransferase
MLVAPRIVLVRPRNPLNIGAAARAMANFGLRELVVVDPHPPVWADARKSAVAGETVLNDARAVATLDEALDGCTRVIGTTAGSRRNLDRPLRGPEVLRGPEARRRRGRMAILFGSEKTGLGNQDLSYCHDLVRLPTTSEAPSMNLAQAVAVCCYEWARGPRAAQPAKEKVADAGELLRLLDIVSPILEASAFFEARPKPEHLRRLRRMLVKARLTPEDAALLTQAARKVEYRMLNGPSDRTRSTKPTT